MDNRDRAKDLGDFIRARRTSRGLSVEEAAEAADLDRSYWNKLEAGQYESPSPRYLTAIAEVLQAPLADLYSLIGYAVPDSPPSFPAYLRSTSYLSPEDIRQMEGLYKFLRAQYDIPDDQPVFPPKPKAEDTEPVDATIGGVK